MGRKKAGKGSYSSSTLHFSQLSIFAGHNFLISVHCQPLRSHIFSGNSMQFLLSYGSCLPPIFLNLQNDEAVAL